ncbi:hypothetical protein F2Q69_00033876 [Brassica cretica]|uniref:Uncharacterized protein n=1 Tax=Brassica cretica TaxID=69181 RepID=A0A8S9SLL5_BRACR|nr:hypothetical protein F2Q69_00033876 [Brassica cretica]
MATSADPAPTKKSRNSRKALKQKNEIVATETPPSPVSAKAKSAKSFEKDLLEMQTMMEKMKIEKDKTEELLKEKDEILRRKEEELVTRDAEQEKLKTELKKLQKMKEFKPNMHLDMLADDDDVMIIDDFSIFSDYTGNDNVGGAHRWCGNSAKRLQSQSSRSIAEDEAIDGTWRLIGSEDLDGNKICGDDRKTIDVMSRSNNIRTKERFFYHVASKEEEKKARRALARTDDSKSNSEIPRLKQKHSHPNPNIFWEIQDFSWDLEN